MITYDNVNAAFTSQPATPAMVIGMNRVNEAANFLAREILTMVPAGADQQAAIRKVREAAMTANKGIVTEGSL